MDRHGSPAIHALSDEELAEETRQQRRRVQQAEAALSALTWERDWRAEQAARARRS